MGLVDIGLAPDGLFSFAFSTPGAGLTGDLVESRLFDN
jgi:hypothetical protein